VSFCLLPFSDLLCRFISIVILLEIFYILDCSKRLVRRKKGRRRKRKRKRKKEPSVISLSLSLFCFAATRHTFYMCSFDCALNWQEERNR
jgi:hypothetical protein